LILDLSTSLERRRNNPLRVVKVRGSDGCKYNVLILTSAIENAANPVLSIDFNEKWQSAFARLEESRVPWHAILEESNYPFRRVKSFTQVR
jgi:hypothetical protein